LSGKKHKYVGIKQFLRDVIRDVIDHRDSTIKFSV